MSNPPRPRPHHSLGRGLTHSPVAHHARTLTDTEAVTDAGRSATTPRRDDGTNPMQRNTQTRDTHRRAIARTKPPCHICGTEIDYTLTYPDPMSYVVDHIVPLNKGGTDTIDNAAAAHSTCNRAKWDRVPEDDAPRTFVTSRTW